MDSSSGEESSSEGSVAVRIKVKEKSLRGLLDSGARDSVINIGTAEMLGIDNTIVKDNNINLWDASNPKMDFVRGCMVAFDISQLQQRITHQFLQKNGPLDFGRC